MISQMSTPPSHTTLPPFRQSRYPNILSPPTPCGLAHTIVGQSIGQRLFVLRPPLSELFSEVHQPPLSLTAPPVRPPIAYASDLASVHPLECTHARRALAFAEAPCFVRHPPIPPSSVPPTVRPHTPGLCFFHSFDAPRFFLSPPSPHFLHHLPTFLTTPRSVLPRSRRSSLCMFLTLLSPAGFSTPLSLRTIATASYPPPIFSCDSSQLTRPPWSSLVQHF